MKRIFIFLLIAGYLNSCSIDGIAPPKNEGGESPTIDYPGVRIVSVSAGDNHTMALDDQGRVWAWGDNYYGQIGDGHISTYHDPVYEYASEYDEYAELVDGKIRNIDNDVYTPKLIMDGVKSICARGGSSYAITDGNELYAWGYNFYGQLGDGTNYNRLTPIFIMDDVSQIDAGRTNLLIVKTDGSLWLAGTKLALEWDEEEDRTYPEPVPLMAEVKKAVYDGASSGAGGVLILTNDGKVIAYMPKELNSGEYVFREWEGLSDITDISSAGQQVYALTENGDVYGWGPGSNLGIQTDEFWIDSPVFITSNIKSITHGHMFIGENGDLLTWGAIPDIEDFRNANGTDGGGQMSGDIITYDKTPGVILGGIVTADGGGGSHHICHRAAVDGGGNVYTWGKNFYGQLGDGTSETRTVPEKIVFP